MSRLIRRSGATSRFVAGGGEMFLAPAVLLGLLAIGAPLWLHRMTRALPTQHPFASLMFIEQGETQRTAKYRLRYWLLLALRILLLAALAFAFAGPLATTRVVPQLQAQSRLHALVLDASLSMQYGDRWRRAIDAAQTVLDQLASADKVMLVRAAGLRMEVVHEPAPVSQAGAVRATLRVLRPGLERVDFGLAMGTADQWLGASRPATVLHFFTDLQRSGAPLRFADLETPAGAQLVLHSVGDDVAANAFIDDAAYDAGAVRVSVSHAGPEPAWRDVVLSIDGAQRARRRIELPAVAGGGSASQPAGEGDGGAGLEESLTLAPHARLSAATASFPDIPVPPGAHRLQVHLEPGDALPQDDRRFVVIENAAPRALLISKGESADDAAYLEAALGSLPEPRLAVERSTAGALGGPLSRYKLVVVADAGALPEGHAARLLEYVAAGGAVLAALGGDAGSSQIPLLEDWRIGESQARPASVGAISTTHPVLREAEEWRQVRFFKQRAVSVAAADHVLIAYDNGAPLLVERTPGAGRMLVLTAPIDRDWNDLAIHPLFVKFIAEAGRYLSGAGAETQSPAVGAVVITGLTPAAGGQIFDPLGERVLSLAEARSAERFVPHLAGFYEVRGAAGARWLAVNVDTRESDLTPLAPAYVQRWRAMRHGVRLRGAPDAARAAGETPTAQRSLGPLLMWAAAALMFAEMLLANRCLAIRRQ